LIDDCVAPGARLHIDLNALRAAGVLPPQGLERQLADEYRRIKWPVLERAFKREGGATAADALVMVTSALPGDGKTFTALNLALSIAREKDSSVLLIDADVAKSHMSELLGIRSRPGLTELLENPAMDPATVIQATDVDGLRVMAAGRRSDTVPELMASQRMRDLTMQLAARNRERVIIFDSSPLLATNESQVLAKLVGQVLLVVRANGTPRPAVEEAVGLLDRSKSIGVVLNQLRTLFGLGHYYSSHYNYGGSQS
jgi:exopolysaccharide/PEP-CTERM locus tyrosine autokinase